MTSVNEFSGLSVTPKCGYGNALSFYDPTQPFIVDLPALARLPKKPMIEAQLTAKRISEELGGKPCWLCLSGGLDSEAMALAFIAADVPFKIANLSFKNGLNSEDSMFVDRFCRTHGLPQTKFEIDCESFYESGEVFDFGASYVPLSPELAVHLWFMEQLDGPFVWGGEAFRVFEKNSTPVIQAVSEVEGLPFRFLEKSKRAGVANFSFYSSELAWSFFSASLALGNRSLFPESSPEAYRLKLEFYRHCGFRVSSDPERSRKLHGFEQLKRHFDKKYRDHNAYQRRFRKPFRERLQKSPSARVRFSKSDPLVQKVLSSGKQGWVYAD